MAGNGIGRLQEDLAVTNKRLDNLETAVERSNRRIEELVEQGFNDLRADMVRLIVALEKKTMNSPMILEPTPSISSD